MDLTANEYIYLSYIGATFTMVLMAYLSYEIIIKGGIRPSNDKHKKLMKFLTIFGVSGFLLSFILFYLTYNDFFAITLLICVLIATIGISGYFHIVFYTIPISVYDTVATSADRKNKEYIKLIRIIYIVSFIIALVLILRMFLHKW